MSLNPPVSSALSIPILTPINTTVLPTYSQSAHRLYQSGPTYTPSYHAGNPMMLNAYPYMRGPGIPTYQNNLFTSQQHISNTPEENAVPRLSTQNDEPLTRLADLLTEHQSRDKLPLPEPDIFRGDLPHFPRWMKSFEAIIEVQTRRSLDQLFYLGKYTAGEPRDAIAGYLGQFSVR
jgi:hypothetical protein